MRVISAIQGHRDHRFCEAHELIVVKKPSRKGQMQSSVEVVQVGPAGIVLFTVDLSRSVTMATRAPENQQFAFTPLGGR